MAASKPATLVAIKQYFETTNGTSHGLGTNGSFTY